MLAPALQPMCITLLRGQHYALVGANGSGKTTLLQVLAGLLRPDGGALIVDGATFDFAALRSAATLIPQHPELLEGTLEHNLSIGASDGAVADEIARSRVVSDLLGRLNLNLISEIQEAGSNWSGGQRQRIALARGILSARGSSLILVDEPTSSIDSAEERYIINQLRTEFREECMLMSVHNLELLRDFDAVIVIEKGALLDAGPPEIVCSRCNYFSAS
jgi:ATP-binding cassette subfamily B protein